ncbi:LamG domain-containing protein [bacterium]|nr:LamG domain-containing protein [bacterium]
MVRPGMSLAEKNLSIEFGNGKINTRNASTGTGFLLTSRGNGIRAQLNNPGGQQFEPNSSSTIMDNTWHLITITVDVSINQMKWYVDNNLANTINFSAGSLTGQGNFVIGWDYAWSGGAEYFRGNIATVSVYNSVLSSNDVSTNFNAVKSRFGL